MIKMSKKILVVGMVGLLVLLGNLRAGSRAAEPSSQLNVKWLGDFDGMVARHQIRALVPYSKTFYFLDKATQRGATFEMLKAFEKETNAKLKKGHVKVRLVIIPTPRHRLLPDLVAGIGDIAAGNLTITDERRKVVDFGAPSYTGVSEMIVTGPKSPQPKSLTDLAGGQIHVRASSSYYASLVQLNKKFTSEDRPAINIIKASEYLEDEDLLEMLNAGLIPMMAIDSHKGQFWADIFKNVRLHPNLKIRSGGEIAWAIRKNSPKLKEAIGAFMRKNKKGTLFGNIIINRYLKDNPWVRNALSDSEIKKFRQTLALFQKYGEQYKFDWLMMAALAYQESTIDQSKRSPAGAIGVMQLLPSTAADPNVGIPGIEKIEPNIHAGTKYLRFIVDRYFQDEPMDNLNKMLFGFASYNAGPAKIAVLRKEAKAAGFDANQWFGHVENIAAKRIGRETVQYVSNIYKYYIAYTLIVEKMEKKAQAQGQS